MPAEEETPVVAPRFIVKETRAYWRQAARRTWQHRTTPFAKFGNRPEETRKVRRSVWLANFRER